MADRNMVARVAFAAVAIPTLLGLVWFGGWPLALLVAAAAALGARELLGIAAAAGIRGHVPLALGAAAAWPLLTYLETTRWPELAASAAMLALVAALWVVVVLTVTLARRTPQERPLEAAALTVLAPLYTGLLPGTLLAIRHASHPMRDWAGTWLVFFPLVTTWVCDSVAMQVGRAVGGAKLAPTVSPGKTWSGTIGGLVGALAVAPLFVLLVFRPLGLPVGFGAALAIAGTVGVMGQVGDLAESLVKRQAGVKDSSHLIPGHGGVLDRLDSLYFVLPLATILYHLFGII